MKPENKTFEIELSQLVRKISRHQSVLNKRGHWLFLTTLACWSVDPPYNVIAILCTLAIFTSFVVVLFKEKGKGTFSSQLLDLKSSYPMLLTDEQIENLRIQHLSTASMIKNSLDFFVGYSFAILTFLSFIKTPMLFVLLVFIGSWSYFISKWISSLKTVQRSKQPDIEEKVEKYRGYTTLEMIELLRVEKERFEQKS